MPTETAADLASMFDDAEFAEHATYTAPVPGAAPAACLVIVDRGQGRQMVDSGEGRASISQRRLWAQASQLASVSRGGTFTLFDGDPEDGGTATGEVFSVAGLPVLDHGARLWSADLVIED